MQMLYIFGEYDFFWMALENSTSYSLGRASQVTLVVKIPAINAGDIKDMGLIPGWEDPTCHRTQGLGVGQGVATAIRKTQVHLKHIFDPEQQGHLPLSKCICVCQ